MKRRLLALFLAVLMTLSLCGCGGTAGQIAGSVMDAAMKELKNQVTQLLEKNKLEVVELKTAFGEERLLSPATARDIYDRCSEMLQQPEYSMSWHE